MGAQGTVTLDFGAFPGASDASVTVTAQTGIVGSSLVEAWLRPSDTSDHTSDEHMVETVQVFAHSIVDGVGFTITGINTSQLNEPMEYEAGQREMRTAVAGPIQAAQGFQRPQSGGRGTRIYGTWSVAWVWN